MNEWWEEHTCTRFPKTKPRMFKYAFGPIKTEPETPGVLWTKHRNAVCVKRRVLAEKQRQLRIKELNAQIHGGNPDLKGFHREQVEDLTAMDEDLMNINSLQICGRCPYETGLDDSKYVPMSEERILENRKRSRAARREYYTHIWEERARWDRRAVQHERRGEGSAEVQTELPELIGRIGSEGYPDTSEGGGDY